MSKKYNLYLGKAGQLAVMSYFLIRGWNVATPEVDVGDDLFVIEDKKGIFYRVQVKTSQAVERKDNSYSVRFNLPLRQLVNAIDPEIYYVFAVCRNNEWAEKIIISREILFEHYKKSAIGTVYKENIVLYFSFRDGKAFCSDVDMTEFINDFENFPTIVH